MKNILKITAVCAVAALGLIGGVQAKTATNTLKTTASVSGTCSFSASDAAFGVVDLTKAGVYTNGASTMVSSNISVLCNRALPFTIKGVPYVVHPGARGLYLTGATAGNTDDMVFTVYTSANAGAGTWFADGVANAGGSTYYISSTGTGANQSIPLYFFLYPASVYPNFIVRPDNYSYNYILTLAY